MNHFEDFRRRHGIPPSDSYQLLDNRPVEPFRFFPQSIWLRVIVVAVAMVLVAVALRFG